MKFSADWDAVEDAIAALWTNARDRDGVTAALHRIDLALQHDPLTFGESRGTETERLVFDGPVSVLFRITAPDCVVVLAVGPSGRHP